MSAHGYVVEVPTRQGPFAILADDEGVLASGWGEDEATLLAHVHASLRPQVVTRADAGAVTGALAAAVAAVRAYDDGTDLDAVARVPVHTQASEFCQAAWRAMREIPVGGHVSYAELAERAGRPHAARAAGGACAKNPTPLFVPCHRVVRADGALGGFAYGVPLKQQLLDAEAGKA